MQNILYLFSTVSQAIWEKKDTFEMNLEYEHQTRCAQLTKISNNFDDQEPSNKSLGKYSCI